MPDTKVINARVISRHDLEANWLKALDFVPLRGELLIYDAEVAADGTIFELPSGRSTPFTYGRLKIGDGCTLASNLPFIDYEVDYTTLAFDTSEIVASIVNNKSMRERTMLVAR